MNINYQEIAKHFCIAAVWADCEEGTRPRVSASALANAERYARAFIAENYALSLAALKCDGYGSHPDAGSPEAAFGHDLWLTARGHGVGFWCRDELGQTGVELGEVLRDWKTWEVEADFYRGWFYFSHKKCGLEPIRKAWEVIVPYADGRTARMDYRGKIEWASKRRAKKHCKEFNAIRRVGALPAYVSAVFHG